MHFNKRIILILLILIAINPIYSISMTSKVRGIGQSGEIGYNILPVSIDVNYHVYDFPIIKENPLEMYFAINGGYGTHSINQDPITGLSTWCNNFNTKVIGANLESKYLFLKEGEETKETDDIRKYGFVFTTWDLEFDQKFKLDKNKNGIFTTWISTTGRFEQAINTISYLRDNKLTDSIFIKDQKISPLFTTQNLNLIGIPELQGNHLMLSVAINGGIIYSDKILNNIPYSINLSGTFSPWWLFNDITNIYNGTSDYFKLSSDFYINKEIYSISYNDLFTNESLKLFSISLKNELGYRYLNGLKVPQFAQDAGNLRHNISERFSINLFGPQILSSDTYPMIELFYSAGYRWGQLNNTKEIAIYPAENRFSHQIGIYFDFRMLSIFHVSYISSYSFKNNDNTYGFNFGSIYFWVNV